ncbi:hypothetical protein J6590_089152, partial [Homalodisca vitripennis]
MSGSRIQIHDQTGHLSTTKGGDDCSISLLVLRTGCSLLPYLMFIVVILLRFKGGTRKDSTEPLRPHCGRHRAKISRFCSKNPFMIRNPINRYIGDSPKARKSLTKFHGE